MKLWPFDPLAVEHTPTQFMIERWDGAAWVEAGERIPLPWVAGEPQTFTVNGIPLSSVADAPADGEFYLRRNNAWESTDAIVDVDGMLAADSDDLIPSQKAVKTYVDNSVTGLLDYKGTTDCSANPNYPAASKGDTYIVSVAGKIGGASGTSVDAGDWFIAKADNAGGNEATVGSSWGHIEHNLAAVVLASGGAFTGDITVPDEAYDATAWDGSLEVPTKNALRDKIETIISGLPGSYTDENARDAIGAALTNGTGITITVNDGSDTITIAIDTAAIDERARDAIGTALLSTTGIDFTVDDAGDTISLTVDPSEVEPSDAEMWTGSTSTKIVTPKKIFDAAVTQTLTDGATITPDGNAGFNFKVTLGGNRTLANPTNMKTGQSGIIIVTQDATGSRTLTFGSNWRFAGGAVVGGILTTAANSVDVISYYVRSDGTILANLGKDYKA